MAAPRQEGATTAEILKWIDGSITQFTIDTAEGVLREEVNAGFTTTPTVITDGVVRRDYRQVKPGGRIEFIRQPGLVEPVLWAREQAIALSPLGPDEDGHYRDDHWILVNGEGYEGQSATQALSRARPGDRVQLVNIRPYARKIEGKRANRRKQWKRRRGLSRMAPNGVYRQVHRMVLQRWGRAVLCDYKLQSLEIGGVLKRAGYFKRTSASGYYTYPVLNFFIRSTNG